MKPTLSERKTVAMLMGGWYDWRDNTINIDTSDRLLNADTMEPVPYLHFVRTAGDHNTLQYAVDVDRLPFEVPWVRNDDDE